MSSETPVTVLMPVYNCEKYVREAIDSVLEQTFTDFEFLIINDGSTDSTLEIINSYADPRIKVISKENGGVSCALNTGLKHAAGKYIARFDADDICYPNRLKEQYEFMVAHPEYVMIGADADYVNQNGDYVFTYNNTGYSDGEIRAAIYSRNPFIHSAVFYVKDVIVNCGGYDLKAHTFEDHLLWIKVLQKGKVCNFRKSFIKVRLNPESVTTDERLRGKRFLEIRQQILTGDGEISDEQEKELLSVIKKQASREMRMLGYHLFIAKKYLWNNHNPSLAREHALAAIKLAPLSRDSYILLVLSFLPAAAISKLYRSIK
jgi:glycosyltransferase involved in cell wall biosynthesis